MCAISRGTLVVRVACEELLMWHASGIGLVRDEVIRATADERHVAGRKLQRSL